MENIVKERLLQFIKTIGITQKAFEDAIGVGKGYINNISKGLGLEKLIAIKLNFSQLNIEWLLTGAGAMLDGKRIGDTDENDKNKYIETLESFNARLLKDVESLEKRLAKYESNTIEKKVG